jgi:hypothetical protein
MVQRTEEHKAFSAWLRNRVGKVFEPGCAEWDEVQRIFTTYDGHPEWAATCKKVRVITNKWGHPATEFLTSADAAYKPGEWVPASWVRCFEPAMNPRRRLFAAMRLSVEDQIASFRASNPRPRTCPMLGALLGNDAEIDHATPNTFAVLVDRYCAEYGTPQIGSVSSKRGPEFFDPQAQAQWQVFHRTHAVLRWLSKEANRNAHRQ